MINKEIESIIEEENIVSEIMKELKINANYEINVEYKNNIFKIAFDEEDKREIESVIVFRALNDYGGIMEELYELDKAES